MTRHARVGCLLVLFLLVVYADPLFFRKNFGGRDLIGYSLPIENAIHDAYSRGRLPLWLADVSGGRPLLPNPNSGALYPVRVLLAGLSFPMAARVFPILHWALAGVGMVCLASSLGLSGSACWLSGVTYAFSGVSVSEVFYPNIHPGMALLPWLLWVLHRPGGWRVRVLSMALVWSLLFVAGDVFACSLAVLATLLLIAFETPPPAQRSTFAAAAGGFLLGTLLAAPQIVATMLWIPMTNRAVLGMRWDEALFFSVSPFRLLEYVIPYPLGPTWSLGGDPAWGWHVFQGKSVGLFTNFYAGALVVIAAVEARRCRASGARFARALVLLTLCLSVLPMFFPKWLGSHRAPLPLRYPEKLAVGTLLGLALLAGIGFDGLRKNSLRLRWPIVVGAALAAAAAVAWVLPAAIGSLAVRLVGADPSTVASASTDVPIALAEGGLLWMATVAGLDLARRGPRLVVGAGLLLLSVVPVAANRRIAATFRESDVFGPSAFDRYLNRLDPSNSYRTLGESTYRAKSPLATSHENPDPGGLDGGRRDWDQYSHSLFGRGTVLNFDFDHGDLSRLESLRGISYRASTFLDSSPFFGSLALRWGIRYRDQVAIAGYRPVRNVGLQVWDEHPGAYPAIRLLERWVEAPDAVHALSVIPRLPDGAVVLETELARTGFARPGTLRIVEKTPEMLTLEARTLDPTWLFVLRGFWDYREVRVDGQLVEPVPASIAFTSVPLPAGSHRIEWVERLPGWRFSRWCFAGFAVLAAALTLVPRRRA